MVFIRSTSRGFLLISSWCLISAIAYVFASYIAMQLNPILLCFGIFFFTLLFFVTTRLKKLTQIKQHVATNFRNIICINITTAGCWFFTILPLKFIEPSLVNAVILGVTPLSILTIGALIYNNKNITQIDYAISILLFLGILFLGYVCFISSATAAIIPLTTRMLAFFCCVLAGVFLAVNNIYAKRLSNNGLNPFDVLSIRFFLIVILTGFFSYHLFGDLFNLRTILDVLLIAISLVILPQILFQYAIKELEPITSSIFGPLMPVIVFFLEFYNTQLHPATLTIIGITYLCLVSIAGAFIRYKKDK